MFALIKAIKCLVVLVFAFVPFWFFLILYFLLTPDRFWQFLQTFAHSFIGPPILAFLGGLQVLLISMAAALIDVILSSEFWQT